MNKMKLSKTEVARKYWKRFEVRPVQKPKPGQRGVEWTMDGSSCADMMMLEDIGTVQSRLLARVRRFVLCTLHFEQLVHDLDLVYWSAVLCRQYLTRWWTNNVRQPSFPGDYGCFEFYCIEELGMPGQMHWD